MTWEECAAAGMTLDEAIAARGSTRNAAHKYTRAHGLKFKRPPNVPLTSEEKDEAIRRLHAKGLGWKEIGTKVDLTASAVHRRGAKMGLSLDPKQVHAKKFGDGGVAIRTAEPTIRKMREEGASWEQIGRAIGVSRNAVQRMGRVLGLPQHNAAGAPLKWSDEEIAYLRENYLSMNDTEIGRALGRSHNSVGRARQRYGMAEVREKKREDDHEFIPRRNIEWALSNFHHEREGIREEARLIARIISDERIAR